MIMLTDTCSRYGTSYGAEFPVKFPLVKGRVYLRHGNVRLVSDSFSPVGGGKYSRLHILTNTSFSSIVVSFQEMVVSKRTMLVK